MTELIRRLIDQTPFFAEGHRKIWARLRLEGIRSSKRRVLSLMRQAGLLSPARRPEVVRANSHDGTIITDRPNQMWGTDATATVTTEEGQLTIFAAIDHCTAECVGICAVKRATRFEALEPIRQGIREQFGSFGRNLEELRPALVAFRDTYNAHWLIERLGFKPPRQVRKELLALGVAA